MQKSAFFIIRAAILVAFISCFQQSETTAQQLLIQEGTFDQTDFTATDSLIYNKVVSSQNYDLFNFMEFGSLSTIQSNGGVLIDVPNHPCSPVKFKARDVEYKSESQYNWFGTIVPQDSCICSNGYLMLASGDFGKIGQISLDQDLYDLIELSPNRHMLVRYDSLLAEGLENCPLTSVANDSLVTDPEVSDRNTANCAVRCLILFTPAALAAEPNIGGKANFSINQINAALQNSKVTPSQLRVELAGMLPYNFIETDDIEADVTFINEDATSDALRLAANADIVVLFTDGTLGTYLELAGVASGFGPNPALTHAIVQVNKATGSTYTFAHEVGHLLGARHEISDDATPGIAHAWDFESCCGYKKTIMHTNADGGKKILNYSNPNVHYCSDPTGEVTIANNSAFLRGTGCTVAGFVASTSGLTARFIGYHDIYACACDNTFTVEVEVLGGATGGYTFEWFVSNDGINWFPYSGFGNYIHAPVPCNIGDRLFVRVTITSSDNQTITVSRVIEAAYEWPGQENPCARNKKTNLSTKDLNFQVFPNPAQHTWYITTSLPVHQNIQFQLVSSTGQVVMNEPSSFFRSDDTFSIENTHLPRGAYFLSIYTEGNGMETFLLLK